MVYLLDCPSWKWVICWKWVIRRHGNTSFQVWLKSDPSLIQVWSKHEEKEWIFKWIGWVGGQNRSEQFGCFGRFDYQWCFSLPRFASRGRFARAGVGMILRFLSRWQHLPGAGCPIRCPLLIWQSFCHKERALLCNNWEVFVQFIRTNCEWKLIVEGEKLDYRRHWYSLIELTCTELHIRKPPPRVSERLEQVLVEDYKVNCEHLSLNTQSLCFVYVLAWMVEESFTPGPDRVRDLQSPEIFRLFRHIHGIS